MHSGAQVSGSRAVAAMRTILDSIVVNDSTPCAHAAMRTAMKIVIAGGSGQIGTLLTKALATHGNEVVILGRGFPLVTGGPNRTGFVRWDAMSDGGWMSEIDGADVVINLAGRSVNCRYNETNRSDIITSRVD